MKIFKLFVMLMSLTLILLSSANSNACPILVGTDLGPPVPPPDPPTSGYLPPGYITDIVFSNSDHFTITYTKTSDLTKTTQTAYTNDSSVTISGIGWHGTRITSLSYSGNNIVINGAVAGTVTGASPQGATQTWSGANGGVEVFKFTNRGTIDISGFSVNAANQYIIAKAGFSFSNSCIANPTGTLQGNRLNISTATSRYANYVQNYIDGVAAGPQIGYFDQSPYVYLSTPLSVGPHTYYSVANFYTSSGVAKDVYSNTKSITVPAAANSVVVGNYNYCMVNSSKAYCWGRGQYGSLGNNDVVDKSSPQAIITSGVAQVSMLQDGACALVSGGVKCWGKNDAGVTGFAPGTKPQSLTPEQVIPANSGIVQIATGNDFACALNNAGVVKCWGDGSSGQMGNGTTTATNTTLVTALTANDIIKISAGGSTVCAMRTDGAYCWGKNDRGQVGNGSTSTSVTSPTLIASTYNDKDVSVGAIHSSFVESDGHVRGVGDNVYGELGNGFAFSGAQTWALDCSGYGGISGQPMTSFMASTTGFISCAIRTTGALTCAGENSHGQLGRGITSSFEQSIASPTGLTSGVTSAAVSATNGIAIMSGHVYTWGDNTYGQIGNTAAANPRLTPIQVTGY